MKSNLYLHHKGSVTDKSQHKAEEDLAIFIGGKNPEENGRMHEFLQMWQALQK